MDAVLMFRAAETTGLPFAILFCYLPRSNFATRPTLAETLDTHVVTPLTCNHVTSLPIAAR